MTSANPNYYKAAFFRPRTLAEDMRWHVSNADLVLDEIKTAMSGKTEGDRGFVVAQLCDKLQHELRGMEERIGSDNPAEFVERMGKWERGEPQ